ncbi:MAG: CopG family ribbon-helix-helix protein [Methermicoccaceae archaeon]
MSRIISISLNDALLEGVDEVQKELGFSGRSEVIRAGIRMLIADSKEREELTGTLNSVLMLVHAKCVEDTVTKIKHEHEEVINTHLHYHLEGDKCLEMLVLSGDAPKIKLLIDAFHASGNMDYVKLIVL